jgi:four helix bundle protein
MAQSNFVQLRVYRASEELCDRVWVIVMRWNWFARATVGRQLVRAADSIGANIAEGTGRGSYLDNRRFVLIARGSLYETQHWLRRAVRRNLLNEDEIKELSRIVDDLAPMLNAYLNSINNMIDRERGNN